VRPAPGARTTKAAADPRGLARLFRPERLEAWIIQPYD
jgi:hypothetical protein